MGQRRYFIMMHNIEPYSKLEKDIHKVLRKYGLSFIGCGYDFTNDRRDIEYRKGKGE